MTSPVTDQLPSTPAAIPPGGGIDDRALIPVERWDLERKRRLRRVGAAILLLMIPGLLISPAFFKTRAKRKRAPATGYSPEAARSGTTTPS